MHNKKLSVTIGIPAHNEESNLANVLKGLMKQQKVSYQLDTIIVICDGCTDNTEAVARSIKSPLIKVINDHKRKGKNARVNEFISQLKSDILVICDADIIFENKFVLDNIISKFNSHALSLVCSIHKPLLPHNLMQEVGYFGYQVWQYARQSLGNKAIRYYAEGAFQAFTKDFAKNISIPTNMPIDDSYFFYSAISSERIVDYSSNSVVYFKLPENLSEYIYQTKRYLSAPKQGYQLFSPELINKYEVITPWVKFKSFVHCSLQSPFISILYISLQLFIKLQMISYTPPVIWTTVMSTKNKVV